MKNQGKKPPRLGKWILWQMIFRTFCLQVVWNFQRMQNLGFAFALTPAIKAIYPTRDSRVKAVKRHLEFFVTHPYCASLILGVVARLEEKKVTGEKAEDTDANQIKVGMMGPLAALGDTLYWVTLKPSLALLGVGIVLLSPPGHLWPAAVGPLVFLGLFTLAHLGLRVGGVFAGYKHGVDIIRELKRVNPQKLAQHIGLFSAILAGVTAASYFQIRSQRLWEARVLDTALLAGLSTVLVIGLRRGISASRLFYLLVVLAILGGYLGLG